METNCVWIKSCTVIPWYSRERWRQTGHITVTYGQGRLELADRDRLAGRHLADGSSQDTTGPPSNWPGRCAASRRRDIAAGARARVWSIVQGGLMSDTDATGSETESQPRLTRDELERRYAAGERQFPGVDLSGADLSQLELAGVDLSGSTLARAKLYGTNLVGANLTECDLEGCFLQGTPMDKVTARRASFRRCRLEGVTWAGVDVQGAQFSEARLKGATFKDCRMSKTGFRRAELKEIRLENCRMYGAILDGTMASGAQLDHCMLQNARLEKADLSDARLISCKLEGADLEGLILSRAVLDGVELAEANLRSADLEQASLVGANLERAQLTRARLGRANLQKARLARADLHQAGLAGANLAGARLTSADLARANLNGADLRGADLDAADLSGADITDAQVDASTTFYATKTIGVEFAGNWVLKRRVSDCAHDLTIEHFRQSHRLVGFFWWLLLGCGKRNYLLIVWGLVVVLSFAALMAAHPASFAFGDADPGLLDHFYNSLGVFVTLDFVIDRGTDDYGRTVLLAEMLTSYLMLGFMASLFASIFPGRPD